MSSTSASSASSSSVTTSSESSDDDDSFILRHIRQLPLPNAPVVVPMTEKEEEAIHETQDLSPSLAARRGTVPLLPAGTPSTTPPPPRSFNASSSAEENYPRLATPMPTGSSPTEPGVGLARVPSVRDAPPPPARSTPSLPSSILSGSVPVLQSTAAATTKRRGSEGPAAVAAAAVVPASAVKFESHRKAPTTSAASAGSLSSSAVLRGSAPSHRSLKDEQTSALIRSSQHSSSRGSGESSKDGGSAPLGVLPAPPPLAVVPERASVQQQPAGPAVTPSLAVPNPAPPAPPLVGLFNAAATAATVAPSGSSSSYAVTTLLPVGPPVPVVSNIQRAGPVVSLPPPPLLTGASLTTTVPVASLIAPPPPIYPMASSASAAPAVATKAENRSLSASARNAVAEKPRHLLRARDTLENVKGSLFGSPDSGSDSSSSSSSSSSSRSSAYEDGEVVVGRTRRVGATAARVRQQRAAQENAATAEAAGPSSRRAPTSRRQHHHRQHHGKHRKQTVVKLREVEGKSPSASSRGKVSQSSQSTNGLSPDKVAETRAALVQTGRGRSSGDAERDSERNDADSAAAAATRRSPLTFTSPAAHRQMLCASSTKNNGPARHLARRLTHDSLLGFSKDRMNGAGTDRWGDIDVVEDEEEEGEGDGGSGDRGHAGTVRFRITGAFSDAASDSRVLHAPGYDTDLVGGPSVAPHADKPKLSNATDKGIDAVAGDTVLALTIRGMSTLHADPGVVHPFVRAWLVSCVTGESLVQASAAVPCAVTQPFDIRARKTRSPWWDAKVALRLSGEKLRGAASDAVVLLEVLDFGNESIHGFPLYRSGLYPICWGFLMLRDCTGRSTLTVAENVHVQLYRYPLRTPWYLTWLEALMPFAWSAAGAQLNPQDLRTALGGCRSASGLAVADVPSIYHIFKYCFNRKLPYEGNMVLTLRQYADAHYVPDTTDMLPYEEYLLSMLVSGGGSCAVPRSTHPAADDEEGGDGTATAGARLLRERLTSSAVPASPWAPASENYYRMDGERSLLPHEVLQTTAVLGIVTCVCCTHNGTLVALGVFRHLQYVVELRNPLLPNAPVAATLLGHTGHLHRIVFQKEDRYMLTCSSDGTVRVWQPTHPNSPFSADTCTGASGVQCVCTLPHGFPIYAAIFHQEKIIAGGFSDQLHVWSYERPLEGELPSMLTADDSALHLTATFTPELQVTQNEEAGNRSTRVLLGELIYRADTASTRKGDAGEATITLSLASNERSNRAWSVHANGMVVCWRAVGESAGERGSRAIAGHNWQMSVRHTADCDGAAEVQVSGSYAVVVCGQAAPLVFVFDATTCEQLRVVNTHLPPATPISLLPDGEAFVGAVGDPSRLTAWECFDGGLCTPPGGYARASTLFGVARMSWAESQQLAVLVSRSPCTEEDRVRFVRGASAPAPGQSAASYYYAQQEEQYRLEGIPSEMTLLTVAGTVRRRATVIQTTDNHASEAFCAMYGGDMKAKRKAEYLAQRTQASRQRQNDRDTRRARLHQESIIADPQSAFAATMTNIPYDATEKGARINAIINFWRGLVGQHKHGADDLQRLDDHDPSSQLHSPSKPSTRRALQYLDEDDGEGGI